jgi:rhodanese-related sulfurtransferase
MQTISRNQARELIENNDDLTIVEVLDAESFNRFHLPGAYHVPLNDAFSRNIQNVAPDVHAPVLLYSRDAECEASPEAASLMEQIGYTAVYDYEAGKADWKEAGLPIEEPSGASA